MSAKIKLESLVAERYAQQLTQLNQIQREFNEARQQLAQRLEEREREQARAAQVTESSPQAPADANAPQEGAAAASETQQQAPQVASATEQQQASASAAETAQETTTARSQSNEQAAAPSPPEQTHASSDSNGSSQVLLLHYLNYSIICKYSAVGRNGGDSRSCATEHEHSTECRREHCDAVEQAPAASVHRRGLDARAAPARRRARSRRRRALAYVHSRTFHHRFDFVRSIE